jgi:hypothetical protein
MKSSIQIALLFVFVRDRCRPRYGTATSDILGNAAEGRKEEASLAGA